MRRTRGLRPIEVICCLTICTRKVTVSVSEGNDAYLSAAIGDVDHQRWRRREYFWITECLVCQGEQTLETAFTNH
jgi:hypothetical protein